jgi:hypothetical protein
LNPQAVDPKLRRSLDALAHLGDRAAIRSRDLSRTHRERLLTRGHLREVLKGWYLPVRPDAPGDPARAWYDAFWAFCAGYLDARFDAAWCLAPEHAIAVHTGDWTVPEQLVVRTARGGNKPLALPWGTSLLDLRLQPPAPDRVEVRALGVRIMDLESALIASPAASYRSQPRHLHAALWLLDDVETLAARLIEGGQGKVAGRLVGALRQIQRPALADALAAAMRGAAVTVTVTRPFARAPRPAARNPSPYPNRQSLRRRWAAMRGAVLEAWPAPGAQPPAPPDAAEAVTAVELTGARTDPAAVSAFATGTTGVGLEHAGTALAAGYLALRQNLAERAAEDPAAIFAAEHREWHRLLLTPSASAGQAAPEHVGHYRRRARYRRGRPHTPPRHEAMRDLLPVLFELLGDEPDARVAAVLGHWLFTLLAPFERGNRLLALVLSRQLLATAGHASSQAGVGRGHPAARPADAPDPAAGTDIAAGYRAALERAWIEDDPRALTRLLAGSRPSA